MRLKIQEHISIDSSHFIPPYPFDLLLAPGDRFPAELVSILCHPLQMIAVLLGIIRQIPLKGLDLFIDPLYFVRVDGFRASRSDVGMPVSDLDSSDVEHLSVESNGRSTPAPHAAIEE